ncbi:hypothetical protein GOBAR_DD19317 [Gossypium barbadense]|nr:hypothetical protein GOBAR_DD19317 [Gossypium barbadense]
MSPTIVTISRSRGFSRSTASSFAWLPSTFVRHPRCPTASPSRVWMIIILACVPNAHKGSDALTCLATCALVGVRCPNSFCMLHVQLGRDASASYALHLRNLPCVQFDDITIRFHLGY